jgi:hypothetical protein
LPLPITTRYLLAQPKTVILLSVQLKLKLKLKEKKRRPHPPFLSYSSLRISNQENLRWGLAVYAFTQLVIDFALFDALLSSVYLVMHFWNYIENLSSVFG